MDGPPLKEGVVFGAASFVVGYLLTGLVVFLGESDELTENLFESAGWLYYNSQFADLTVTSAFLGAAASPTFNYLTDGTLFGNSLDVLEVPGVIYHLIPVVVLVGAGFLLAGYADARSLGDGALAGGSLVAGTLVLALVGTVLFSVEQSQFGVSLEASPALVQGTLLVGILYPAVFGALGGMLSAEL